ncbi:thymidylate synthase [Lipomyces japonicus]|uniref:thymidylate synthase n=1 Tax=Lipomyces japonicus TaxID=56871 RepID=UPI0034CFDF47
MTSATLPNSSSSSSSSDSGQVNNNNNNAANHEEQAYLDLCARIINQGERRDDRTGTGTVSIFAPPQLRFNLNDDTFPLLTTKRVFLRGIIHELLWFIQAGTSSLKLAQQGVHIWDGNGSRQFLDAVGLTDRQVGDLGPVYGFQWRHFGAAYVDSDADYSGQGVDQLADLIWKIKHKPHDRRLILSAWNPADIPKMALPPCHMFAQFYVSNLSQKQAGQEHQQRQQLSCCLYQRSADMGLGVPFNIASYALLTKMIAHVCGLEAGEFVHTLGDAHVYVDHVDAVKIQLSRTPRPFPKLRIARTVTDIDDFKFEDFVLEDYKPMSKIDMKMSV